MKASLRLLTTAILVASTTSVSAIAEAQKEGPRVDENGAIHVPAFVLPPSALASQEARDHIKEDVETSVKFNALLTQSPSIPEARKKLAELLAPKVEALVKMYPVNIAEETIGDVPVRVVTPKNKSVKPDRVLIHLHGGGFIFGWESGSIIESAPVAVEGGYRVVSVNYSKAPEARHPAGVKDVEKVYRELLKEYQPSQVGVYGCSAGGALTAQTAAWLPAHGLPQVGAVGIFGAGGVRFFNGDSAHLAPYLSGLGGPDRSKADPNKLFGGYFADADLDGPIVAPALHLDVLAKFPPTMIITGSRAMDMSPAIYTNSQLIKAGKNPLMIVGESLGHCYHSTVELPESQDANQAIVRFFNENLH